MGRERTEIINQFDLGIHQDPRVKNLRYARMVKNFDVRTYPFKLAPFRSSESGDSAASTSQKQNFVIAYWDPAGTANDAWKIFSLGVKSGAGTAEILMKDLTTGGTEDLGDNGWATPANNQSSAGATSFDLFVYYNQANLIIGARAGTNLWAFTPNGSTAWSDSWQSLTYETIAQGLVHSKDDILYIPYNNKIASYNHTGTVWNATALTLPTDIIITSIAEYGNYLAIAAKPKSGFGKSIVYLWDRDASLTTLSEKIDWGEGNLQVLEELDGYLVGISFAGSAASQFVSKVIFKFWRGGKPQIFKELVSEDTFSAGDLPIAKQKANNAIYFMLAIKINGTDQEGLWRIDRIGDTFAVVFDRTPNNDSALTSGILHNFIIAGDFVFISYTDNGVKTLSKTDDQGNYTASGTYESLLLGDPHKNNKLISVGVMTEAMPAAGQIILKYLKDEETSYTTIYTNTTDNSIYKETTHNEDSGNELPQFREISFQVLSTGNAVVTGLKVKWEEFEDNPSD